MKWIQQPFVVINVLLLFGLLALLLTGTHTRQLLSTAARATPLQVPGTAASNLSPSLEIVQQAALFQPTRQFYAAPVVAAVVAKPEYRVTGTFAVPNKTPMALLTPSGGGAVKKVAAGDVLEGWIVIRIEPNRVLLRLNGEQYELTRTGHPNSTDASAKVSPEPAAGNEGLKRVTLSQGLQPHPSGMKLLTAQPDGTNKLKGTGAASAIEAASLYQPPPR